MPGQVFAIGGSADTWHRRVEAAALAAARHAREDGGPIGAASHRAGARLFGFRSVDEDIDVTVVYPRQLSLPGARVVRSRDLDLTDLTWVDGIPVTTPERTIVDLGLIFPEHEVMRILRHSIAVGLVNRAEVLRMRLRTSKQGRDGTGMTGRCLEALPELAEKAESGLEVRFLEICAEFGVPIPVLQLPVVANNRAYRLDFGYPAEKVFVEIDGSGHGEPTQIAKDGGRQNDLVVHGWQPIRLHHHQLKSAPEYCATTVQAALAQRFVMP